MTEGKSTKQPAPETGASSSRGAAIAEQSQRIVQTFLETQGDDGRFSLIDPKDVSRAFMEAAARLMTDPAKLVTAQLQLWQLNLALWDYTRRRLMGESAEPLVKPARSDRRFKDKAWEEDLLFDVLKQSYLLTSGWMRSLVAEVEGLDDRTKEKVAFYTRQYVSAMAPSNFVQTNPAVLREIKKTGGENLLTGLQHLLNDLERGKGRVQVSMTDADAFRVGENIAVTPGKVIYQNELMQLIQYAPSTDLVYKRPLLYVPHWINKFYVMDLQPRNSLIKWLVDQGHTMFVISWVNPGADLAHKKFEDYMLEGPLAALDVIAEATGETEINIFGFCIGGILTIAILAYMAARGDHRIKSASLLASIIDFTDVGEASVFIDEGQLAALEEHVAEKGYLEGHHMADMFNMMRENDLIWSFVVNNYLLGRDPIAFDLLYWNSDSTRLPATMLLYYLRKFYLGNQLAKPGGIQLADVSIDIRKIEIPTYFLTTKEDHISPWRSSYPATQLLSGPIRFVLGGSGHIAGVANPPTLNKYCYWTNAKLPPDPDAWFAGTTQHEGSWWPDWGRWLARHSGPKLPAREPGGGRLRPIEDAPGSYVKVRASE